MISLLQIPEAAGFAAGFIIGIAFSAIVTLTVLALL